MPARVLTLRVDPVLEAFDDGPLREFLKAREASAIREHFFVRNDAPYLPVLVTYGLEPPASGPSASGKARNRGSGWRSQPSEADMPLFNALRECLSKRAGRVGIPPYMVCSNKQLAAMTNARPLDGLTDLPIRWAFRLFEL